ncbi:hypothetical protein L1887_06268 [Cichorium endivia]|nr:hypothetical protein L1887_06268 [Cichorium endivia]
MNGARQHVKRVFPNLPQHQACLDVIEEGIVHGGYAGVLKLRKDAITQMIWVFLYVKSLKKPSGYQRIRIHESEGRRGKTSLCFQKPKNFESFVSSHAKNKEILTIEKEEGRFRPSALDSEIDEGRK